MKKIWTEDQIKLLIKLYEDGMLVKDIQEKYFPQFTFGQVSSKCSVLGLKHKHARGWSKELDDLLIEVFPYYTNKEISEKFIPNKSYRAIESRARSLNLNKIGIIWTDDEDELLKNLYGNVEKEELYTYFDNKTKTAIQSRAKKLGLTKEIPNPWTDEEVEILYKYYEDMGAEWIYNKFFQTHTIVNIRGKANSLGLLTQASPAVWTEEEINILKEKYCDHNFSIEEIAKECHKTKAQVERYAYQVLHIIRKVELFTEEERKKIIELYPHNRTSDIAFMFPGRTIEQIERCAVNGGARKTKDYIRWVTLEGTKNSIIETKPQIAIDNLLDSMGISYEPEYDCKYYLVDHYLNKYNLMIEVQGDFWHCSPLLKSNNSKTQGISKNLTKDKRKHTYIKNNYNIEILYLWESDINENIKLCEKLIQAYIENKGVLDNYHSFNYYLDENDNLILREQKYVIGY